MHITAHSRHKILIYSILLIIGMICSQLIDVSPIKKWIEFTTLFCLSYIMIEVGLEFTINKNNLVGYVKDYLIAATAAGFPWILCAFYFYFVLDTDIKEALLVGRFAAPTSAGILFAMLSAAGLGLTWLFRKARILAIFDDLDTILFMIPLQMMFQGFAFQSIYLVLIIIILLFFAYRFLHKLKWPTVVYWRPLYAFIITCACKILNTQFHIDLEVLLPAFVFGCILYNPHNPDDQVHYVHEHAYLEPEPAGIIPIDSIIKYTFMFLVGDSIPKIPFHQIDLGYVALHVLLLTFLSNLGKMFPTLCYRKEATTRERLAVSIAMFPRGEVGAGVLLVALNQGLTGAPVTLGALSLALNLLLTGVFISIVIWLISDQREV
ncbi:MAG: sodium:proton antiporter [Chlamydiales bacterium]